MIGGEEIIYRTASYGLGTIASGQANPYSASECIAQVYNTATLIFLCAKPAALLVNVGNGEMEARERVGGVDRCQTERNAAKVRVQCMAYRYDTATHDIVNGTHFNHERCVVVSISI